MADRNITNRSGRRLPRFVAAGVLVCVSLVAGCTSETTSSQPLDVVGGPTLLSTLRTSPGQSVLNSLEIDGTTLSFQLFVPRGFTPQSSAPVLLALPPGGQTARNVTETMQGVYIAEAARRGWVVVSPIAPGGVKFFEGSESLIPELMAEVMVMVLPEGGRPHLAGMSNGGISAFRIAGENPDNYASITVFPGFPQTGDDKRALRDLTDIPITLFAGSTDTAWVDAAEDTAERLEDLGANVTLQVVPGAGHLLQSLWQGDRLWDTFAAARLAAG